jgi:hypothetical protein
MLSIATAAAKVYRVLSIVTAATEIGFWMSIGPNALDQLAAGAKPGTKGSPVLSISGLTTSFMREGQWIPVVRNVSFDVAARETAYASDAFSDRRQGDRARRCSATRSIPIRRS